MQRAKASRSIVGPLNRNGSLSLADARKHAARSRFTSASGAPGLSYTPRPLPLAQPTSSPMIPTTRIPVVGHLMALLLPAAIGGFYRTPTVLALPTSRARLCSGPVCFRVFSRTTNSYPYCVNSSLVEHPLEAAQSAPPWGPRHLGRSVSTCARSSVEDRSAEVSFVPRWAPRKDMSALTLG